MKTPLFLLFLLTNPLWAQQLPRPTPNWPADVLLHTYYQTHDRNLVPIMVAHLDEEGVMASQYPTLIAWFGALFKHDSTARKAFYAQRPAMGKNGQMLLDFLSKHTIDALLVEEPVGPNRNDMGWASFFATGDTTYVARILHNAVTYDAERTYLMPFLAAHTAKWSLASNARQHPMVRDFLTRKEKQSPIVHEILTRDPGIIMLEMTVILQQQQAKGGWRK